MKKVVLAVALVGFVFFSYTPVEAAPQVQCQQCRCQHSKYTDAQFAQLKASAYNAGKKAHGDLKGFGRSSSDVLKLAKEIAETLDQDFRCFFWEGFYAS